MTVVNELSNDHYTTEDRVEAYGRIIRFLEKGEDQVAECCDPAHATYLTKLWNDRIDYEQQTTPRNP